jgi:hypothetical protein
LTIIRGQKIVYGILKIKIFIKYSNLKEDLMKKILILVVIAFTFGNIAFAQEISVRSGCSISCTPSYFDINKTYYGDDKPRGGFTFYYIILYQDQTSSGFEPGITGNNGIFVIPYDTSKALLQITIIPSLSFAHMTPSTKIFSSNTSHMFRYTIPCSP